MNKNPNKDHVNIIEIPESATNGDVIRTIFTDTDIIRHHFSDGETLLEVDLDVSEDSVIFNKSWWDKPYKNPSMKSKKEPKLSGYEFAQKRKERFSNKCSKISNEICNNKSPKFVKIPNSGIGDLSDGYHTFNDLYYQRLILFATIVNSHPDISWKSHKHEDGKLCFNGGWFIVGIDTPDGPYTYHYENMYWDIFKCRELDTAKTWDGHTDKDVTRLLSLVKDSDINDCDDGSYGLCHNLASEIDEMRSSSDAFLLIADILNTFLEFEVMYPGCQLSLSMVLNILNTIKPYHQAHTVYEGTFIIQ